jgi:hypothetical protein
MLGWHEIASKQKFCGVFLPVLFGVLTGTVLMGILQLLVRLDRVGAISWS